MAILSSLQNIPAAGDLAVSTKAPPNTSLTSFDGAKSSPSVTSHSTVPVDATGESTNTVKVQSAIFEEAAENTELRSPGEILSHADVGKDEPAKKRPKLDV